jgi:hypothetical protein
LKALIAAPKEEHARLLEKRASGATVEQLQEEVRQIRERGGIEVLPPVEDRSETDKKKAAQTKAATIAAAEKRRKSRATIAVHLEETVGTIDLFAKPNSKDEVPREARTMEDQPWGKLVASNGVELVFRMKQTSEGKVKLVYYAIAGVE